MKRVNIALAIALLGSAGAAHAGWYTGVVSDLGVGYDGSTIILKIAGWSRTDCTCYATWPNYMCLDRTRTSFKEEYASVLRARATGQTLSVQIDETTCRVQAYTEVG